MTTANWIGSLRRRVGNPTQSEVPDRELQETIASSIKWMSGYLRSCYVTDQSIPLVANQMEYTVPKDALLFSWVMIGGKLLQPTSSWSINSGAVTTTSSQQSPSWMTAAPGLPTRYAVEGRELILNPPPDAGTAASFPTMSWRYLGTGSLTLEQNSLGLGERGHPSLSDLDEDLVMYYSAAEWLGMRLVNAPPDRLPGIQAQIAELEKQISRRLPEAKRRWMERIQDYLPTARPDTSGRLSSAR